VNKGAASGKKSDQREDWDTKPPQASSSQKKKGNRGPLGKARVPKQGKKEGVTRMS